MSESNNQQDNQQDNEQSKAKQETTLGQSINKNALILAVFALICTSFIAVTNTATKKSIAANKQKAVEKALFELVPKISHDNNMLSDAIQLEPRTLSNRKSRTAYFAFKEEQAYAVVLPATAPDGYGGEIQLIVGIYYDGRLAGVRNVPPHNETPGLGDAIESKKSDWILGFNGKSLNQPKAKAWKVKKDGGEFDQMTGATITPRAIVKAVHKTLIYFKANKQTLFEKAKLNQAKRLNSPELVNSPEPKNSPEQANHE